MPNLVSLRRRSRQISWLTGLVLASGAPGDIPVNLSAYPVQVAVRPAAPWPPAEGLLRVIIETDAGNEVIDQWAIALALGFPEQLQIENRLAAHHGPRWVAQGIEKSFGNLQTTRSAIRLAGGLRVGGKWTRLRCAGRPGPGQPPQLGGIQIP